MRWVEGKRGAESRERTWEREVRRSRRWRINNVFKILAEWEDSEVGLFFLSFYGGGRERGGLTDVKMFMATTSRMSPRRRRELSTGDFHSPREE